MFTVSNPTLYWNPHSDLASCREHTLVILTESDNTQSKFCTLGTKCTDRCLNSVGVLTVHRVSVCRGRDCDGVMSQQCCSSHSAVGNKPHLDLHGGGDCAFFQKVLMACSCLHKPWAFTAVGSNLYIPIKEPLSSFRNSALWSSECKPEMGSISGSLPWGESDPFTFLWYDPMMGHNPPI